jgi:hypothetical protein
VEEALFDHSDLFLALAQIAGVFVGFGALIGVSRGRNIEPRRGAP